MTDITEFLTDDEAYRESRFWNFVYYFIAFFLGASSVLLFLTSIIIFFNA